jgi:hypothetical protein
MAATDFIEELKALGYAVEETSPSAQLQGQTFVEFPFQIPLGTKAGEVITLGFIVPEDYPMACPSGPYIRPHLLPVSPGGEPPFGGVIGGEQYGFAPEWQYWSRPYQGWAQSERNAKAYTRHIKHLFHLI